MANKPDVRAVTYSGPTAIQDKGSLKQAFSSMLAGAWDDFKQTNKSTFGKGAKFGASLLVGGAVARELGTLTPLQWAARGFGALPQEFTKSGAIQVFEYSGMQRLGLVAATAAAKFCLVTVSYEFGVAVGSVINQSLSERTKDAIGGTINEIVNESGWKLLFTHPFGIGM